ncbi:MAG: uroporphyrinogen decarboxylase family protein [Dehalococcoidia bacterium]
MMDRTQERLQLWCSAQSIQFISPEAEEAYKKRAKRVADVIQLRVPDRVPIVPSFGMFPALDNGFTCEEVMFDYYKAQKAWMKTLVEFKPDMYLGSSYALPGPVLEALNYRQLKLPGRGVSPRHVYQFVEGEYVKADEFYDIFIDDPSDFMLRVYLPRVCSVLEPLKAIRPLTESFGYYISLIANVAPLGTPGVVGALESLLAAGGEARKWAKVLADQYEEITSMGFPLYEGGESAAPFDIIGDWFRGTRGVMIDMYRRPSKLIEAMERLVPILVRMGLDQATESGLPIVGLMLHKGAEGFMSPEQYKTFYWPTLRKVMMGLIDEGLVPMPLFEGDYTSRLEIIKDIPRGKAVYWFEKVDIYKVKEILADTACFRGNVPIALLHTGTPQQVKDYVKELIDVVGNGGGLIVDCAAWFDEAKHENVKAMVDFTKEYGIYR